MLSISNPAVLTDTIPLISVTSSLLPKPLIMNTMKTATMLIPKNIPQLLKKLKKQQTPKQTTSTTNGNPEMQPLKASALSLLLIPMTLLLPSTVLLQMFTKITSLLTQSTNGSLILPEQQVTAPLSIPITVLI